MKTKYLVIFLIVTLLEGVGALIYLLSLQFAAGRGHLFNYQTMRMILAGVIALVLAGLLGLAILLWRKAEMGQRVASFFNTRLIGANQRLFPIQTALPLLSLFLFECFLLTYLAFPIPIRPVFLWASLVCLQGWLSFRLIYAGTYRQRPSLAARLRAKWQAWLPVQRRTFVILAVLGLVYFLAFVPANYLRDAQTHFNLHPDEDVIYPDIVVALTPGATFAETVHNAIENWQWWYGFPYLPISAAVLLIPRLIFGSEFGQQVQLNIFLLRQFVSVLPMTLAILLTVYLVTHFKSVWASVGLFLFMAVLPGVVSFNIQFWHPDSIIVLLILLTIYFLQKDNLRYGRYFYLAAVACGLATAIKLWGVFFVAAIGGYIIAGMIRKVLTFKKAFLAGLFFLLAMAGTIVLSSPTLLAPYITKGALEGWMQQQNSLLQGYSGPDPEGVYQTGLTTWLRFFSKEYMYPFFFFFAFLGLIAGSFLGSRKYSNRVLLGWSIASAFFLINFAAMKSPHYMMPVMIPLICGAALFPTMAGEAPKVKALAFLAHPVARKVLIAITVVVFAVQFAINVWIVYGRLLPS